MATINRTWGKPSHLSIPADQFGLDGRVFPLKDVTKTDMGNYLKIGGAVVAGIFLLGIVYKGMKGK